MVCQIASAQVPSRLYEKLKKMVQYSLDPRRESESIIGMDLNQRVVHNQR